MDKEFKMRVAHVGQHKVKLTQVGHKEGEGYLELTALKSPDFLSCDVGDCFMVTFEATDPEPEEEELEEEDDADDDNE